MLVQESQASSFLEDGTPLASREQLEHPDLYQQSHSLILRLLTNPMDWDSFESITPLWPHSPSKAIKSHQLQIGTCLSITNRHLPRAFSSD